jgi:hypothetical protein
MRCVASILALASLCSAAPANPTFRASIESGRLRVYLIADDGERVLVRSRPDRRTSLSDAERTALGSDETRAAAPWLAAKARLAKGGARSLAEQHDDWLEVSSALEEAHVKDPDHLGILRDLLVAYAQLLAFESSSALGRELFLGACRRLAEFEQKAAPLDDGARAAAARLRAWLFLVMDLPPAALSALTSPSELAEVRALLAPLGQDRFQELPSARAGAFTVRVFQTTGSQPDEGLLWGEVYWVATAGGDNRPDRTVAYVLARRGGRSYLVFRSANQQRIVALYGAGRPARADVEKTVKALLLKGATR